MNGDLIPKLYNDIYIDKISNSFYLVYNTLSLQGLNLLNKEGFFCFKKINGKRSIKDIFLLAKKINKNTTLKDIKNIFKQFLSLDLIYFNYKKDFFSPLLKPPTHLGVWFHITNQCNLRCTYCYVWKTSDKMSKETGEIAAYKIIKSAKKHNIEKITFKFSGGECLLELPLVLHFVNFIRRMSKKENIDIDFVILTNGVLLTEKVVKILKKHKLRLSVSLDGLEKYNDKQRIFANGLGSFKYVEKGINNLLKEKIPFNVSVTITKNNIKNIPELTEYLLDKKIRFVFNFYRENELVNQNIENDNKKLIKYLKKAYQIIAQNPPKYNILGSLLDRVNLQNPHLYTCAAGRSYIIVRHDGKISSCQMMLNNPIGSIDDNDLIDLIVKKSFIKPNGLTVEGKYPCNKCLWKYVCAGGCPLLTFNSKKTFITNSTYCDVYKTLIPEVLRVEAKRLLKYYS